MKAEIHQLRPKPAAVNWMCSACGVDAGCNCGAPLMSKAQRAAEAIAADPRKSDRAIAADIGVSAPTVGKARREAGVNNLTPDEERIGRDGKNYPARRAPVEDDDDDEIEAATPSERRNAFLIYSNEALLLAKYEGPADETVLEAARATASAWSRLVSKLEQET